MQIKWKNIQISLVQLLQIQWKEIWFAVHVVKEQMDALTQDLIIAARL